MSADLPCLSTMALLSLLGLSVLVREFRLVRVPCLDLTTAASVRTTRPVLEPPDGPCPRGHQLAGRILSTGG